MKRAFAALLFVAAAVALPRGVAAQTALTLPAGFHGSIYASGLSNPTAMSFGPDGRLYVAQGNGAILAIRGGKATTIASGFATALGLAWHGKTLYVSWTGHVSTLTPSANYRSFRARTIVSGIPTGRHQN